jgi:nucleotide-binding universal stress UspA family protein
MQKIYVPLDGSGFGEQSVTLAATLARNAHVPMELLHVHVPHPPVHLLGNSSSHWEGADLKVYDKEDRENEYRYLQYVAARIAPIDGAEVRCVMLKGEIPAAIHAHVGDAGDGLILMGTHGLTGLSRARLGSVADAVVRFSPIPVLLVHASEGTAGAATPPVEFERILIALDGSKRAEQVLTPAVDIARAFGAQVKLFHVMPPGVDLSVRSREPRHRGGGKTVASAFDYLEEIAVGIRGFGVEVTEEVVDSPSAASAILDVVRLDSINLVALATRGQGGIRRAMLGSVADRVLRGTDTPLLVVAPN